MALAGREMKTDRVAYYSTRLNILRATTSLAKNSKRIIPLLNYIVNKATLLGL
jgi:hypothetical protein